VLQLLAHAVVLYRVVHYFLQPLYRLWLQSDPTASTEDSSNQAMLLSQLPLVQLDPINWQVLVQLAASSSSLTRHTLLVGVYIWREAKFTQSFSNRYQPPDAQYVSAVHLTRAHWCAGGRSLCCTADQHRPARWQYSTTPHKQPAFRML
jgi:hypothetical protein